MEKRLRAASESGWKPAAGGADSGTQLPMSSTHYAPCRAQMSEVKMFVWRRRVRAGVARGGEEGGVAGNGRRRPDWRLVIVTDQTHQGEALSARHRGGAGGRYHDTQGGEGGEGGRGGEGVEGMEWEEGRGGEARGGHGTGTVTGMTDGRTLGRTDRRSNGRSDRRTEGRSDGWMDGYSKRIMTDCGMPPHKERCILAIGFLI